MAPHEFVEIRLVCKADYLDPQLKTKLREIRDQLRQLLHTGKRRFTLKKVQPWNSVKVTFDIPKEAADRLRLFAVEGNVRLIELGILSVEIVGQSNTTAVNNNTNPPITTTNSKELTASSSFNSTSKQNFPLDTKSDDHRFKRIKIENDFNTFDSSSTNNKLIQPSSTSVNSHYLPQRHSTYPITTMNSGLTSNSYLHDNVTLLNGNDLQNSWSGYKMKITGLHYYPSQQNPTSTANTFESSSTTKTGLSS